MRERRRWMLPLMFTMSCILLASCGATFAIIVTLSDGIESELRNVEPQSDEWKRRLIDIIIFRIAAALLVIIQLIIFIIHCRCYRYLQRIDRVMRKRSINPIIASDTMTSSSNSY